MVREVDLELENSKFSPGTKNMAANCSLMNLEISQVQMGLIIITNMIINVVG